MKKTQQKNKGGRPPKFESVEKLQGEVIRYLKDCENKKLMPNRAGLCVFLDITRETYYEWRTNKVKGFSDTIKSFEQATESIWVQRLGGNSPTGAIFYLKNAFKEDYKDRYDTDLTSGGKALTLSFDKVFNDITRETKRGNKE